MPVTRGTEYAGIGSVSTKKPVQRTASTSTFRTKLAAKPVQPTVTRPAAPTPSSNPDPSNLTRSTQTAAPAQQTSSTSSEKAKEDDAAKVAQVKADAEATLQSQLDAVAAQYGLTRAQLDAEGGEIGRQWEFAKAELLRQSKLAQEASLNDMVSRGILRSGITAENAIRLEEAEERTAGTLDTDKAVSLADIASRRAALDPQQKAEEARLNAEHEAKLRDLEIMKAAYGQG